MAERELLTAKVYFRVEPSKKKRWLEAAAKLGVREVSDFYRDAIDSMADAVLAEEVAPEPASVIPSG